MIFHDSKRSIESASNHKTNSYEICKRRKIKSNSQRKMKLYSKRKAKKIKEILEEDDCSESGKTPDKTES